MGKQLRPIGAIEYKWHFNVDSHLALNLTFHFIYFSSVTINYCFFGSLAIQGSSDKTNPYLLCGIHPRFVVYPESRSVSVTVTHLGYELHDTRASFAVLDSGRVTSSFAKDLQLIQPDKHVAFVFGTFKAFLSILRLEVKRHTRIVVEVEQKSPVLHLFDGPGIKSKKFSTRPGKRKSLFIFSSFQCVLYQSSTQRSISYRPLRELSASSLHTQVTMKHTQRTLTSNTKLCAGQIHCLILVKTTPGTHVKIAVTKMSYNGNQNTGNCLYGGLTVFHTDKSHICPGQYHIVEQQDTTTQPEYSTGTHLLLVVYQYKEYGSINMILELSTTSCKVHRVDPCMSNNTVFPNLFLSAQLHQVNTRHFQMHKNECIILQLSMSKRHRNSLRADVSPLIGELDFPVSFAYRDVLKASMQWRKEHDGGLLALFVSLGATSPHRLTKILGYSVLSEKPRSMLETMADKVFHAGHTLLPKQLQSLKQKLFPELRIPYLSKIEDEFLKGTNAYFQGCQLHFQMQEPEDNLDDIEYHVTGFFTGIDWLVLGRFLRKSDHIVFTCVGLFFVCFLFVSKNVVHAKAFEAATAAQCPSHHSPPG